MKFRQETNTIAAQKIILTVFSGIDGTILINRLTPEKIQQRLLLRKRTQAALRDPARQARCSVPKAESAF
jgi:hypothetical protein